MSRRFTQTVSVFAVLGFLAFAAACGDDDDGAGNHTIDAGSPVDAGPPVSKTYNIALTKSAEVPVCNAAGATARGDATLTVSADDTTITVHATFSGLGSLATMAHLHPSNTPVLTFPTPIGTTLDAVFTADDYQNAGDVPPTFAAFVRLLRAGGAYLNIHTANCPSGEIRGQIR